MVTLTNDELKDLRVRINAGELPPDAIDQYYIDERKNVFGQDHKLDARGQPIEQGVGSALQPSANSVEAYRKYGRDEVGYEKNLARMEKQLADYLARRRGAARQSQGGL